MRFVYFEQERDYCQDGKAYLVFRAEYNFELQLSVNKDYWRNFCISPTFSVCLLCFSPNVLRENMLI